MKAFQMTMQKTLRQAKIRKHHAIADRERQEKLRKQAVAFREQFPHVGTLNQAKWAINKVGLYKAERLARENLTPYLFRQAVSGK